MFRFTFLTAGVMAVLAVSAQAECLQALTVKFAESAPRDRFDIIHTATGVFVTGVSIDLRGSQGALVFDTAEGGSGTQVFQPFEPGDGMQGVDVADGAQRLDIRLTELSAGQRTGFTIDVDDQQAQSDLGQIRVTGGELSGARVLFSLADGSELEAVFDADNRAKVCT
ncbi:aggregation factor core [uncultured Roseobacter sp.]|uniref:aggregation factor core n=1 Tax=uncultured Roseobacter sp. TaxID=114847 RepID=UPI00262DEF5D|nr:aggregation factor core [uncultured Roseobacter sp.]